MAGRGGSIRKAFLLPIADHGAGALLAQEPVSEKTENQWDLHVSSQLNLGKGVQRDGARGGSQGLKPGCSPLLTP